MSDQGTPPPPPPPPPPGYGAPVGYGAVPGGPPPNNHLVWAILSTLFCCLPLGIASIVFAAQVSTKWQAGDAAGAIQSAEKARKFALWGTIIGAVLIVLVIAFYVVVIAIAVNNGDTDY